MDHSLLRDLLWSAMAWKGDSVLVHGSVQYVASPSHPCLHYGWAHVNLQSLLQCNRLE
ncbi:hypothetical protein ANCCAN_30253 [Ancylostoma caninum]|uniref:Uncharacterized protein n=1 Tax=Ancylostoma caninum TaxID=29170 RepID=A0A368EXK7_ANCCA|nr:hypothetical protein ANCCAN_30253 [Ancylostoma caninum]